MWAMRDGQTRQFLEPTSLRLEFVQHNARIHSQDVTHSVEVVELETMRVCCLYVDGQEFVANGWDTKVNPTAITDQAAEAFGKRIWEDLAARQMVVDRLLHKLKLSAHEEKQFELTQDKVAERELELSVILTDAEYQCAYYTFLGSQTHRREFTRPNYCERQIRRHTKKALIKTGQTALDEEWEPIKLILNKDQDSLMNESAEVRITNTN